MVAKKNQVGRQLAHTGVVVSTRIAHERIDADPMLTPGEKFWAHLGVVALQVGGHVAVEAIADWIEGQN